MISISHNWDDYCQIPALNPSTLVYGIKSMRSLKRAIDGQRKEPTDAMRLGTGIHCLLLEPDEFEERFCVVPDFHLDDDNVTAKGEKTESKSSTYYKERVKQFASANAGKSFLSRAQYDACLYCIESLRSRPHVVELLRSCGRNLEVTVTGEICGVPFRGRIDALAPGYVIDLKTTDNVEPRSFGRTFANLYYGMKLAIYRELVRQNSCERQVKIIAVEKAGDFDCCVYDVPGPVLDNELAKVFMLVQRYKRALDSGIWPGVDDGEDSVQIYIPQWAQEDAGGELIQWAGSSTDADEGVDF